MTSKLTQKQEMFCLEYIKTGNATAAYRASYDCSKMKEATINRNAKTLLDSNKIATRIKELNQDALTDAVMTRREALEQLSTIARTSVLDLANFETKCVGEDENGNPIYQSVWSFKDADELQASKSGAVIKSITAGKGGLKFEIHDKTQAIKQLAEMNGWNANQRLDVTVSRPKVTIDRTGNKPS